MKWTIGCDDLYRGHAIFPPISWSLILQRLPADFRAQRASVYVAMFCMLCRKACIDMTECHIEAFEW
ncbi:hypothetical protein BOP96_14840 [Pseudomonas sp. FSL W5-0203]|nr:hypothetical protein PD374_18555 [Pseudomonas sp. WCS374]AOS74829.1 hypothetical protein BH711_13085 [Pseudomonas fluorescens]OJT29617.1 hypothetical protein BOP96_14840 [Pseudomonas sp. FSL W5-0203]PRW67791.1 hypothetical protein C7A09_17105 [Pseudomonas fluorescens]